MAEFDDDVDFKNLAKEVSYALAKNEKYQRENDAKFRAIHQKVKSYDEFRDIVDASHLKPLDKTDKIGGITYQKWNHLANANTSSMILETKAETDSPKSFGQPANSHEFSKVWKRSCSNHQSKFDYLVSINLEVLKKCLEGDCMLGEIIGVLYGSMDKISDNLVIIINVLNIISLTNRFSLALDFLSSSEKNQLRDVFNVLHSNENEQCRDMLKNLVCSYKLQPI